MLITSPYGRFFTFFLLASLMLAPAMPLYAAKSDRIDREPRLSEALKSPLRDDAKYTANYWLKNYGFTPIKPTQQEKINAEINRTMLPIIISGPHQTTYERTSRLNLLESLQIINTPGQKSVLEGIGTTLTHAGKNALFNLMAQEVSDWDIVKKRQEFIKILIEHPDLLTEIQESLRTIQTNELKFLFSIVTADEIDTSDENTFSKAKNTTETIAALFGFLFKKLTQHFDGVKNASYFAGNAITATTGFLGAYTALINLLDLLNKNNTNREKIFDCFISTPENSLRSIFREKFCKKSINAQLLGRYYCLGLISSGFIAAKASHFVIRQFKKSFYEWFDLAQGTAQVCRNSIQMHEHLCASEQLRDLYPTPFATTSPKWGKLLNRIEKSTFDADVKPTLFLTNHGRVYNTIRLMKDTKNELGTMTRFYGELDAYQAIAQFYLDHQNAKNSSDENIKCCLVDFVEDSEESILHTENFWHPIIPTDRVRPSSVWLGGKDKPRNLVITGPNAGGKSVNLKALLVNLILAQTFGVACAESFQFTAFKKIIARLSSADDTAGDKSKFMLEAIEMTALLKEVMSLKPGEHAFVETDELFTGTEVGPAISLSIELCAQIAKMRNVMYLLATHYKQLTDLKQVTSDIFDNYRVDVFKDPHTGKLVYPYSLMPGIGNTNVAFDIFLEQLKEQGINNQILVDVITRAKARQEAIEAQLEHISLATGTTQPAVAA